MIILPADFIIYVNRNTILTDGGFRAKAGFVQNTNSFSYLTDYIKDRSNLPNSFGHIVDIATFYFYKIIQNHIFYDGNKRTASFCAYSFVLLNGYSFIDTVTDDKIVDFALSVASGEISQQEVKDWFKNHILD